MVGFTYQQTRRTGYLPSLSAIEPYLLGTQLVLYCPHDFLSSLRLGKARQGKGRDGEAGQDDYTREYVIHLE